TTIDRIGYNLRSHFQIRIGKYHYRIFRPSLGLYPFSMGGTFRINIPGNWGAAHKTDRPDRWMFQTCIYSFLAPMDKTDQPIWDIQSIDKLKNFHHGQGYLLRGLNDKCIPGRDRIGRKPEYAHAREVKWRNTSGNTQRLP